MISLSALRTAVQIGVVLYELVKKELSGEPEPKTGPLPWKDVERIRNAQIIPESHKVRPPKK
jgi:hypothetical protein